MIAVQVACQRYDKMRKEAASRTIQKDSRMYLARKAYKRLCSSAVSIQTGMRVMVARNELRFRRRTKAAIVIQVKSLKQFEIRSSWLGGFGDGFLFRYFRSLNILKHVSKKTRCELVEHSGLKTLGSCRLTSGINFVVVIIS